VNGIIKFDSLLILKSNAVHTYIVHVFRDGVNQLL